NIHNNDFLSLFLKEADKIGLKYLSGHMLVGGVRASIYNAMPEHAVDKLIDFMNHFANKYSG
nr:3-phosphoserine/phosphohydroxythreonine transaminase [Burkholderiales bacterium]